MNRITAPHNAADMIRTMNASEFQALGGPLVAYVRRIDMGGIPAYALHGADGTKLGLEASEDLAALAARERDLLPVMVQ
ncbi:MAG: DUF1150 family protein [Alphaproteobacteria bacterium]|nr:DUF1150 family protein [Alphaproteobacteria bacterium]